ncbi:MAG: hypothetical protein EB060_07730 [Proteobacteria bacterium]|nr:hypothetical protein [Pseudomonadota bacterium]
MTTLAPFKITPIPAEAALSVGGFSFVPDVNTSLTLALRAFNAKYPGFDDPHDSRIVNGTVKKGHFAEDGLMELKGIMEAHLPPEVKASAESSMKPAERHITLVHGVDPELVPLFSLGVFAWKMMEPVRYRRLERKGSPQPTNAADVWHRDSGDISVFGMQNNVQQAATTFVNMEAVYSAMTDELRGKLCIIIPKVHTSPYPNLHEPKPKTLIELQEEHHRMWKDALLRMEELFLFSSPDRYRKDCILMPVEGLGDKEEARVKEELSALVEKHRVSITLDPGQVLILSNGQDPRQKYADLGRVYHRSTPGIVEVPSDIVSRVMLATVGNFRT